MNNANEKCFIHNIYSRYSDKIRVDILYQRFEKEAHQQCGLYYEIYLSRLLSSLRHYMAALNTFDATQLRHYVESQGISLDDETYRLALMAENECLADIAQASE